VPNIEHCKSASEFIALLRPSNPRWLAPGDSRCSCIFRGQTDAAFDLTPTAWRPRALTHPLRQQIDAELSNESVLRQHVEQTEGLTYSAAASWIRPVFVQRLFEYRVVQEFIAGVDRLGWPIPGGAFSFPNWYEDILDSRQSFYRGATSFHPAFALARHHGMPSRLSDWTKNPLTAAFFPSEQSEVELSDRIAVWAYRVSKGRGHLPPGRPQLRVLEVERSNIGFLHAQEGLFL
jgi:FRG domain